jgi:release factor glutamine methyltransferase
MSATLVSHWTDIRKRLQHAGVESPVFDARMLLEAGAEVARLDIITEPRRPLSDAQLAAVETLVRRREAREPMAYILGRKAFWSIDLAVNASVLIPRPETETLVATALKLLPTEGAVRVLDLGIGSGTILLALLRERAQAFGVGVDVSEDALQVAQANAEALGLGDRVRLCRGEWAHGLEGGFDLVVSNPPYIPSAMIDGLEPEVARYEPRLALDGGADGLDAYRAIVAQLPRLLRPGGSFAFEVGQGQADAVASLARAAGLVVNEPEFDLGGIARVVHGGLATLS